jgi:predicted Fe-Mo cluster-binding NifX family protein
MRKMKAAFAYWDNRIAPVFDTARQIHIVEVESGQIVGESLAALSEVAPNAKALRLTELGVGTLVCGAISGAMRNLVEAYGIQVISFVAGDIHEVIHAWLSGDIHRGPFFMPGCGRRGRHRHRGMS